MKFFNIYFGFRLGLANAINNYKRLKIRGLMLINLICDTKSESGLFLYTRNHSNERLKQVFEYKITF